MTNISQIIRNDLLSKYGKSTISKIELANEMGIGLSTLNKYLSEGIGLPEYKKVGTSKNSRVLFPIQAVAEFLADTTKTL